MTSNVRLDFARKHIEKPPTFWNQILWTDETKINLHHNDGKRKVWSTPNG